MCTLINEQKSKKNIKNQIELKNVLESYENKLFREIITTWFFIFSASIRFTLLVKFSKIFSISLLLTFISFCFFVFLLFYLFIFLFLFFIFRFFVFYILFLSLFFIFYFFYFSLFVYLLSSNFFLLIILQRIENIWRGPRTTFLEEHWLIFSSKLKINK